MLVMSALTHLALSDVFARLKLSMSVVFSEVFLFVFALVNCSTVLLA